MTLTVNRALVVAVIAGLLVWPLITTPYGQIQANRILIYALLTLSFVILAGRLGWFSLCQTTFSGVASYGVAILGAKHGIPFPWPALAGLAAAIGCAAVFGLVVLHTRRVAFLMLTLALGQVIWGLAFQWIDLTGGYNGIAGVREPALFGLDMGQRQSFYVVLAPVVVALFLLTYRLFYASHLGLVAHALETNEQRARSLGQPVALIRYLVFLYAGALAGIGGIFLVYHKGLATPSDLALPQAVWVLTAAVLGGYRSIWGAALGAAVLVVLETTAAQYTDRHMMIVGGVLLATILLMPNGLSIFLREQYQRLRGRFPVLPDLEGGHGASTPESGGEAKAK